jgi:NAD(P)-dependent dehydrogenase (short-subunit alcohol dehydrogenase family)
MFNLENRLALVTGSGQGIGAGIAHHLARQGADVVVNDIVAAKAEKTAKSIEAAGGKADALAFDVTNREQVCDSVAGRNFDIVVNNAGNAGAAMMMPKPFREMDPAQWAAPIDVNLHGVMNTTHAVLPGMCDRGFGRLITIASGAGVVGLQIGVAPYGAGKAGAISFMRHMAIENAGFGVTANSLALGLMEMTEMTEIHDEALVAKLASTVPCGRLGTGDDLGPAVVWLASNEASWVTGQTIHINGGSLTT